MAIRKIRDSEAELRVLGGEEKEDVVVVVSCTLYTVLPLQGSR